MKNKRLDKSADMTDDCPGCTEQGTGFLSDSPKEREKGAKIQDP